MREAGQAGLAVTQTHCWPGGDMPPGLTGLARLLQHQLVTESQGPGLGEGFEIHLPAISDPKQQQCWGRVLSS